MILKHALRTLAAIILWLTPIILLLITINYWPFLGTLLTAIFYGIIFDIGKFKNWLFKN